jgi:hypothetical protein
MENLPNVVNGNDLVSAFTSIPGLSSLVRILQAASLVFIAYLIFLFVKGILQYKGFSRIKRMEKSIQDISSTLKRIEGNLAKSNKKK